MRVQLPAVLLLVSVVTPAKAGAQFDRDEVTAPRSAVVNAGGARLVKVEARAGSLRIEGRKGITEIRATGTARASHRQILDEIKLSATREGDRVLVIVDIPDRLGWSDNRYAMLDLVIEVPDDLPLDIEDSSGEIQIRGVGGVDLKDSSGEIDIENISGSLRIEDSSGRIGVRDVRGNVSLRDGSGEIEVRGVKGSVEVEVDGSGSIDVSDVTDNVRVGSDGSGSIEVRDVGGDFSVGRDGSGGIGYRNVKGTVRIPSRR